MTKTALANFPKDEAIRAATDGKPLSNEDKQLVTEPVRSGRLGTLSKEELLATKLAISAAKGYIWKAATAYRQ